MFQEVKSFEDFEKLSKSNSFILFHFWADWNGSDFLMKNILQELKDEFDEKIVFSTVDISDDANEKSLTELCRTIPILNVPTLVFVKNGEIVSVDVGLNTKELKEEKQRIKSKLEVFSLNE